MRIIILSEILRFLNILLNVEDSWSPAEAKQQLEDSLNALCADYIDIYQFHSGDDKVFENDELWRTLEKERRM